MAPYTSSFTKKPEDITVREKKAGNSGRVETKKTSSKVGGRVQKIVAKKETQKPTRKEPKREIAKKNGKEEWIIVHGVKEALGWELKGKKQRSERSADGLGFVITASGDFIGFDWK
jgi:hypothetical protein